MNNLFIKITGVIRLIYYKIIFGHKLRTKGLYVVERGSKIIIRNEGEIKIGKKAHLFPYSKLLSKKVMSIGNNFNINSYSRIIAHEEIMVGDNVTIAQFVSILDHDHDYEIENDEMIMTGYKTAPITIGSNVWIADKVTILKGVEIGSNVIIGANSLVTKNVPNNCIVAGNPVRVIKGI